MRQTSLETESPPPVTIGGLVGALKVALPLIAGLVALVAISGALSAWLHLDFYSILWITFGLALVTLTLTRPWWFWFEPKVQLVQFFLGERGTVIAYVLVGVLVILIGSQRQLAISSQRNACANALATAKTSHERFQILRQQNGSSLQGKRYLGMQLDCEQLLEPK